MARSGSRRGWGRARAEAPRRDDPHWYKDAILYELHVRAFRDSDGDGVGDFRGLTEKLDYLRDLGVTALWLLPFYPSPLKDDGYDIADYTGVHPAYGTLADFKLFLREAHARELKVITELVLNHTSDQHPWFQRARRSPVGSPEREFYVWSETPDRYADARIIFKDFETSNWAWDPLAKAYYWHRFYAHQPDLNFDSPEVHRAMLRVVDFWLELGVDGLRLDAVPYLYEREGTHCENLPETHAFLKALRAHVDSRFHGRMLLAEANQWPEQAVDYFGSGVGDECHTAFHFPLMPRLFMAIRTENRFPLIDILEQTPPLPSTGQWVLFLRNHDELTLEMVTDEERDYMYRVFADDPRARINLGIRRRLAPLLDNDRRRIELMNALLFSLPGTPVIYYADEIGMGDNIYLGDRNGVRTPMQWSADRNAGFSSGNPQRLYLPVITDPEAHYEALNVEAQLSSSASLLWWMRHLIALRKSSRAFGRGTLEFLQPENRKVLAFLRRHGEETVLVVANLSRFAQFVELDLSAWAGRTPVELFGRTDFPTVGAQPYLVTLTPYAFHWFSLELRKAPAGDGALPLPTLAVHSDWLELLAPARRDALAHVLAGSLPQRRWYRSRARSVRRAHVREVLDSGPGDETRLVLLELLYAEGEPETYLLGLARVDGERARALRETEGAALYAELRASDGSIGLLHDPLQDPQFALRLLADVVRRRRYRGERGEIACIPEPVLRGLLAGTGDGEPRVLPGEQSNTTIAYGRKLVLKLYRTIEQGPNPDLEVGRFLTLRAGFEHTPAIAGWLEYQGARGPASTLGVLSAFVENEGDAWRYTLDAMGRFLDRALPQLDEAGAEEGAREAAPRLHLLELAQEAPSDSVRSLLGTYLDFVQLLGARTAQMHLALASRDEPAEFAPEPLTGLYQRALYQLMRSQALNVLPVLRRRLEHLDERTQHDARRVLQAEVEILERFRALLRRRIGGQRVRIHGDYHLGQVLYTGKDIAIIDFEGEPTRPLGERRIKRSPLRDVAGMLRSFQYAAWHALDRHPAREMLRPERLPLLEERLRTWHTRAGALFLGSYLKTLGSHPLLPPDRDDLRTLCDAFLLEKAVYEVGYELNHRPTWVAVPLAGILALLEQRP